MSQFESLPTYLSHYPLKFVPYFDSDGIYAGETDAHFLSLGNSTWSKYDLSLKVWRRAGNKFLRQSEEVPLHRAMDLVLLLLSALNGDKSITLSNDVGELSIGTNPPIQHSVRSLGIYFEQRVDDEGNRTVGDVLRERLVRLHHKLDDMHSRGDIF